MRNRLKRLREAASKALEVARTGPADALKNVTEGLLDKATASGLPPEVASAGSTAAAGLWARVSPKDPLAQARLAEALVRAGRAPEVLGQIAVDDSDTSREALLAQAWLARAEALSSRPRAAERRIERVLALLPAGDSRAVGSLRGVLSLGALDVGAPALARRALGESREPTALVARGRLALEAGDGDGATAAFEEAAAQGHEEAKAWKAIALATGGQPRRAKEVLEVYRALGPERAWVDLTLGWLRLSEGDAAARHSLELALSRALRPPGAQYLLAALAEREGDLEAAREAFQRAAEAAPGWAAPWLGVLRTAMTTGDFDAARWAAQRAGIADEDRLMMGLAVGLGGDLEAAEELWRQPALARDRELARETALLRGALAWRLTRDESDDQATAAWKAVADHASLAGSARVMLARWAVDAAHRCLDRTDPPYYLVEAALAAATALRPESEDLVVGHCTASFLARGPAAARATLEAAVARGATDDRITGLLGLLDAATRGGPAPATVLAGGSTALEAAEAARAGDAETCLALLEQTEAQTHSPALHAVLGGAKALARLADLTTLLREGKIDDALALLENAMEHVPSGLARDRLVHDLAAVSTIAARRADASARQAGDPPGHDAMIRWQQAIGYWVALGRAQAYWAELAKRVLEYDDPRLTPKDVDRLRAELHDLALSQPAAFARQAILAGHRRRARAFVALLIGAPVSDEARQRACELALSPLLDEVHRLADDAKKTASDGPPEELEPAYHALTSSIATLREELSETAPDTLPAVIDALDELALCLVKFFENLHDRAQLYTLAIDALAAAANIAASETLETELKAKLSRMRDGG